MPVMLVAAVAYGQGQDTFRPLSLSGRVVTEDGSPLPEPAVVELRCEGQRLPQRQTNAKGAFTFRIGGEPSRGLADSQQLDYDLTIDNVTPGEHTIAVRVEDEYDNQSAAKTVLK
jgi:hypothetical protein